MRTDSVVTAARRIETVLYTAAHGGFASEAVPLGGGAAIANLLEAEWARTRPFNLKLLGPAILGASAPTARAIVGFNESQYAAFCDAFREASTAEVLRHDPARTAVLVNDISEGPDFERLVRAGFRIVTIYHVDVVAYIASIYLRGTVSPATLTRWWERLRGGLLRRLSPAILRLIFEQQRASLHWSERVAVPSEDMRTILTGCYPAIPPSRIEVLPWGVPPAPADWDSAAIDQAAGELRREYAIPAEAQVLLCLSRISPEKGQDVLLRALAEWERSESFPAAPLWLFICGEPAFMQGGRFGERLRSLARRLRRVHVVFPGYVSGLRKQAFFRLASLYLFPSAHESYGLTLMEALGAGLPAICRDHSGARQILRPEFGIRVDGSGARARRGLIDALARVLGDSALRESMAAAAADYTRERPFARSAGTLAEMLTGGELEPDTSES